MLGILEPDRQSFLRMDGPTIDPHGMTLLKVCRMKLDASLGAFEAMEIHFLLLQVNTHEIIRLVTLNGLLNNQKEKAFLLAIL